MDLMKIVKTDIDLIFRKAEREGRFSQDDLATKEAAVGWGCMSETDGYKLTIEEQRKLLKYCQLLAKIDEFNEEILDEIHEIRESK